MEAIDKWVSAIIGKDQYKTELITDAHRIFADEPIDNGGKDTAPSPGDFLRMSLASCTAITLRMYANRKGYDVDRIEVKVHSEKIEDATIFDLQIKIEGKIDDAIRKRMHQIADLCPIHKLLTGPIGVRTRMTYTIQ